MLTFAITFCLIFQSAVAIYLLKETRKSENFKWRLRNFLFVLLVHITIKFFLLFIIKSAYSYGIIATGFSLFYAPYFFIITKGILNQPVLKKRIHLHLFPFYLFSVAFVFIIFLHLLQIIKENEIRLYNNVNLTVTVLSFVTYAIIIKTNLKRVQNDNGNPFHFLQKQLVSNVISIMLVCGCVVSILKALHFVYPKLIDVEIRTTIYLHLLLMPILAIRYTLKSVAKETSPITSPEENEPRILIIETTKRYQKSGIDETDLSLYEEKILKHIKKNKPYLDAELSLEDLAKQTGIPKHHVTQTLNDKMEKSFYQFINEYRIEEAKCKLKNEKEEVSMLSLAFDVGFNSKSSFNNNFKKLTGHTPSSYRKAIPVTKE